jgi:predicted DNA-binding transcriptional regulator YafY
MKLLGNLSRLITEIAALDDVQKSIKQKNVITINYDGDEYGKGYRDVEPVCLGVSKAGNMVLRAWERQGASHSNRVEGNPIPGWRLFRLDKILTYLPQGDNFIEVRPNYNPNGDRSMTRVILNAVFDNTPNTDNVENIDNTENIE